MPSAGSAETIWTEDDPEHSSMHSSSPSSRAGDFLANPWGKRSPKMDVDEDTAPWDSSTTGESSTLNGAQIHTNPRPSTVELDDLWRWATQSVGDRTAGSEIGDYDGMRDDSSNESSNESSNDCSNNSKRGVRSPPDSEQEEMEVVLELTGGRKREAPLLASGSGGAASGKERASERESSARHHI
jgi:hypothetical protein